MLTVEEADTTRRVVKEVEDGSHHDRLTVRCLCGGFRSAGRKHLPRQAGLACPHCKRNQTNDLHPTPTFVKATLNNRVAQASVLLREERGEGPGDPPPPGPFAEGGGKERCNPARQEGAILFCRRCVALALAWRTLWTRTMPNAPWSRRLVVT